MARDEETARYRQAAELTLDQIEWCIEYLRGMRKLQLSRQLAGNHAAIGRRLHKDRDDKGSLGRAPRH